MHPSVMEFLRTEVLASEILGKQVLEVGSQDVNGSPRTVLMPHKPAKYTGIDFGPGKGVDVVMDVASLTVKLGAEAFDVVISTEMLEHAKSWRTAVDEMKAVLKVGGLLILTARGPGFPYHGYPHDYWRFTVEDFQKIFADMEVLKLAKDDPQFPGVLLKARKVSQSQVDLLKIEVRKV